MNLEQAIREWSECLPSGHVDDAQQASARYGADTSGQQRRLLAALRAQTTDEVQQLVRIASCHGVALHPISTGKNWGYGSALPAADALVLLDLSGMRSIAHLDTELGVVTLEPGVTQAQLAQELETRKAPWMVPTTGAGPACSLLGNALERGYGITPTTDHFAAVTDLEAVLPDGSLYRSMLKEAAGEELARLFRWGIGPYTLGLFTQSGMGIVTKMTIALARRPEEYQVFLFGLRDDAALETAVESIRGVMQSLPGLVGGINLMNRHRVLSMTAPYPHDRLDTTGCIPPQVLKELGDQYQVLPWTGFATLYGTRRTVRAAKKELQSRLGPLVTRPMFVTPRRAQWLVQLAALVPGKIGTGLRRLTNSLKSSLELVGGTPNQTALPLAYWRNDKPAQPGASLDPAQDGCGLIWYAPLVPMRGADARRYVDHVTSLAGKHGMEPLITFTTVGDRLFDSTVPLLFDRSQTSSTQRAQQCLEELIDAGRSLGFYPYRFGIGSQHLLQAHAPQAMALHARLLPDNNTLISPGRYGLDCRNALQPHDATADGTQRPVDKSTA